CEGDCNIVYFSWICVQRLSSLLPYTTLFRSVQVGALGQDDGHLEALPRLGGTGGVVQGGGVHLHQGAGGAQEGLHLAGVQTAVRHLLPLGQQEDKVLNAHVQLAVPVVLQAVELGVV